MKLNFKIGKIIDGQYDIEIDLNYFFQKNNLSIFKQNIQQISSYDADFNDLCSLNSSTLKYKSESIFPLESDKHGKKKIMIILGNPATHSVKNKMFFYCKKGGKRHQFWGKMQEAGLMKSIELDELDKEAARRRKLIESGTSSADFLLGLTTFYSLPTPVFGAYRDVRGVEKLFSACRSLLQKEELKRLLSYPYSLNSTWIFTQRSSYEYVSRTGMITNIHLWPIRGPNSSGKQLLTLIK